MRRLFECESYCEGMLLRATVREFKARDLIAVKSDKIASCTACLRNQEFWLMLEHRLFPCSGIPRTLKAGQRLASAAKPFDSCRAHPKTCQCLGNTNSLPVDARQRWFLAWPIFPPLPAPRSIEMFLHCSLPFSPGKSLWMTITDLQDLLHHHSKPSVSIGINTACITLSVFCIANGMGFSRSSTSFLLVRLWFTFLLRDFDSNVIHYSLECSSTANQSYHTHEGSIIDLPTRQTDLIGFAASFFSQHEEGDHHSSSSYFLYHNSIIWDHRNDRILSTFLKHYIDTSILSTFLRRGILLAISFALCANLSIY